MTVDIDTRELRGAAAALRGTRAVDDAAQSFVELVGPDALAAVKARARRHRRTGTFEAGIRLAETGSGIDTRARVTASGDYAGVILSGSVPHVIRARHGRPLPLAGAPRPFARSVHHPGTKPDPIFDRAIEDLGGSIDAALKRAGDRLVDGIVADIRRV